MKKTMYWLFLFNLALLQFAFGQRANNDNVRLFQTFFQDAAVAQQPFGEASFGYADFGPANSVDLGVDAGFPVSPQFEVGVGLHFININPDFGDGNSGITDLPVFGKFHLPSRNGTQLSAGGFITLPIGSEDIGGGDFDFGGFGALRHPLSSNTVLTGTAGLNFLEFGGDREVSLLIGGGLIYEMNPDLNFIGELNIQTKTDGGLITGGIDYESGLNNHFRAVLGIGVDSGSPDFLLRASFLTFLK